MSSIISSPTYDPPKTAAALAQKQTEALQQSLDAATKRAGAVDTALTKLRNTISAFQTSLNALTGLNKSMFAQSATFSDTSFGSASAGANAVPGTYSFFVEQVAAASQISYAGLAADSAFSGKLVVKVGDANINLDLDAAGGDLTVHQLATAINSSKENTSLVTAAVINTGSGYELVLTANNTGENSKISFDTTDLAGSPLSGMRELVKAQDAIIRVGSENGTAITQASNTFTSIDGVKMTFTRAQATGSRPVTVTVAADTKATADNVQAFVDAYNKLKTALDAMLDPGDPAKGIAPSVFAQDAGMLALRDRLVTLLRPAGGASLASYGITGQKDGTLGLDTARLNKQLATDPHGLDKLIGNTASKAPSGIAAALDSFLKGWSNSVNGQLKKRQETNTKLQTTLTDRQGALDRQYDAAYQRYLMQFTQLQVLQGQMTNNSSMFDALFGKDSK